MKLIALLRAVNVGGRVVKMDQLRDIITAEGFTSVETFIASGNVIVDGRASQAVRVEAAIERALRRELGYEVATFVRTDAELAAIAAHQPFPQEAVARAATFCVAFLKEEIPAARKRQLLALRSDVHDFHAGHREVFWLSTLKQSDPAFAKVQLERVLGSTSTVRGVNTVRRLAARYPPRPGKEAGA
jgi:uncharacterized protein (DUF1697 family)